MSRSGPGRTVEGTVRDLARGGDAVVDTPRGLVFAAGALPGERVRLGSVSKRGKVLRGEVRQVLAAAPERVVPPCAIADRCGGCPWMILEPGAQRERKRRFVTEAAGVEAVLEPGGSALGYRRRARLSFRRVGARALVGYLGRRSHRIVDAPSCAVLEPALEAALSRIRQRWAPVLEGSGEIALGRGEGGAAVIALRTDEPQPPGVYEGARELAAEAGIAGVALRAGGATTDAAFGDPRERTETAGGRELMGTVAGFSQAQQAVNVSLVSRVLELAQPEGATALELYAGHGNLTVPLASVAADLLAVEQDAAAAEACRDNLRSLSSLSSLGSSQGPGPVARGAVRVVTADAADHAGGPRVDLVVLDPPRSGAAEVIEGIVSRRPERIVYVSCDTATLARDVRALRRHRYEPDRAHAFDMFPQTAHVEAVVRLVRSD